MSAIANRLCASADRGSSAKARSNKPIASARLSRVLRLTQCGASPKNVIQCVGMRLRPGGLRADQLEIESDWRSGS